MIKQSAIILLILGILGFPATPLLAAETPEEAPSLNISSNQDQLLTLNAGPSRDGLLGQPVQFDLDLTGIEEGTIQEILWDFGNNVRTTGQRVSHTYQSPGTYLVKLTISTGDDTYEDTTEVRIFKHLAILVSDNSAPEDAIELRRQQAAKEGILLLSLSAKSDGPEVLVEEELTQQLLDIRPTITSAHVIVMWTSGGVGANILTKFSQHVRQSEGASLEDLNLGSKGIILLSETPYGVLKPTAQSAFDQLHPSYVLLARPGVLDIITAATTADEAKDAILASPLNYRLLGTFSSRTVSDLGLTNFMSFSINYLVNRGVPINSIILILMLPVVATILAFARQVIGAKSFGLITPTMTTLSFLVMGLTYGLIVFAFVLISGTLTRFFLRRLNLLYLPRMALVLTGVSLSLLIVLALGVSSDRTSIISFSIFPALILTILAEEFIAAQFKLGVRTALGLTAWTLGLSIICYYLVSSEIFRTLTLSFPEIVLLTIPINIIVGKWSGLRLTEYFRFRHLLRHGKPTS